MKNNVCKNFEIQRCSSCGACINICPVKAITYGQDGYGFTKPVVNEEACIDCGKCISACPFRNELCGNEVKEAYATINKDGNERYQGSSGGIFSILAKNTLKYGGRIYGCTMDNDFNVKHISVDQKKDIRLLTRSKYVQSFMGSVYQNVRKDLQEGKRVLFVGTPCETVALRSFVRNTKIATENLIVVDVVCHGVPNQELFSDYVENLGAKYDSTVEKFEFRAKKKIDNGMNCFFSFALSNGKKYLKNWPEDSFNYYYMTGAIYRESCYVCPFASLSRQSDITLCDYWNFEEYHDEFKKTATVSAVLLNTEKGVEVFDAIKHEVTAVPTSVENVASHNSCLVKPSPRNPLRENVLETWKKEGYAELDRKFENKYRKQILKYKALRHIPTELILALRKAKDAL